eukprot:143661-Rhodomonas_salina.1
MTPSRRSRTASSCRRPRGCSALACERGQSHWTGCRLLVRRLGASSAASRVRRARSDWKQRAGERDEGVDDLHGGMGVVCCGKVPRCLPRGCLSAVRPSDQSPESPVLDLLERIRTMFAAPNLFTARHVDELVLCEIVNNLAPVQQQLEARIQERVAVSLVKQTPAGFL